MYVYKARDPAPACIGVGTHTTTHIDNDIKYLTFEAMWPHGCGYQQSLSCLQAACVQIDRSM